jgi:hypothetical protein
MKLRWIYWPPLVHLMISLAFLLMYFDRRANLKVLNVLLHILLVADFPLSVLTILLVWGHDVLGVMWLAVAGTLWWYLLSRAAEYFFCLSGRNRG